MLTGFAAAITSTSADISTVGAGLVTLALVGLGIAFVIRRLRG